MLEEEGADLIQTEGGTSSAPSKPGVHGLIEKVFGPIGLYYKKNHVLRPSLGPESMFANGVEDL